MPDALAERMAAHQALVDKWAAKINLTSIQDPREAAVLHGLDCLLFAELIDPEAPLSTVDVGSGAGFPGVIVALARPKLRVCLLEPIRKRASFLRVVAAELGLDGVRVLEGKLEATGPGPKSAREAVPRGGSPWPTELLISRATIPPETLAALAVPRLTPTGRAILTSGAGAPAVQTLAQAAESAGGRHLERRRFELPGGVVRILDVLTAS